MSKGLIFSTKIGNEYGKKRVQVGFQALNPLTQLRAPSELKFSRHCSF